MFPRNNMVLLYASFFSERQTQASRNLLSTIWRVKRLPQAMNMYSKYIYEAVKMPNASNVIDVLFYLFWKLTNRKSLMLIKRNHNSRFTQPTTTYSRIIAAFIASKARCKVWEKRSREKPTASGLITNDDKYEFIWLAGEMFWTSVADIIIKNKVLKKCYLKNGREEELPHY